MNPGGHHANGFRATANNLASTSSHNYNNDFVPRHHSNTLSFANDVRPQPLQHQQHLASANMSSRLPHNQWQQLAMQMNAPHMNGQSSQSAAQQMPPPQPQPHQQQQQQFTQMPNQMPNQMPWGNQLPAQGFPNGMSPMGFNMPFFPTQILQEAYAMSAPVEASDEPFLLTKLLDSSRRGESYKDSLNSMHGKNGHSASLWKDYYLDHKVRIDAWIAMCLQKEKEKAREAGSNGVKRSASSDIERVKASMPSIKKPSPASFKLKREPSPHNIPSRLSISAPPVKHGPTKRIKSSLSATPPIPLEQSHSSRRSTINSLTAPAPVFGNRLPPPHADIKIPEPPSRSPTPPTVVIPAARGNKYTPEDRDYFIKFIGWRLKQDSSLTRNELCDLIAQKAPHHTAQSWASHWSNNHDVPDKILAAARGEEVPGVHEVLSDEERPPQRRRPKYKETTTSEEESESEDDGYGDEDAEGDDDDDEDVKPTSIRRYSESQMSQRGAPFNDADLYITAQYIRSLPNWHNLPSKDKWEPYGKKYPQRSHKSWAEYYRRYEPALLKMVRKLKKAERSSSSILTQCARPTRTPPNAKRKHDIDLTNGDSPVKRARS
ncbi:hypothetical protein BDN70DRAFT_878491 [Pholiota conissans]|uniref:Uncharacterized protein n=1 Tax=Pholiota conissans TaxID=109636 RepID=A0A9P5Z5C2_9AGAR|nr:hypothetical protein BDN70DRAFT_878491 [Pholiota conissans]